MDDKNEMTIGTIAKALGGRGRMGLGKGHSLRHVAQGGARRLSYEGDGGCQVVSLRAASCRNRALTLTPRYYMLQLFIINTKNRIFQYKTDAQIINQISISISIINKSFKRKNMFLSSLSLQIVKHDNEERV